MNRTKLVIAFLSLVGILGISKAEAGPYNGETSSTHNVVFSGPGILYEVLLPTGTAEEYVVYFDTTALTTSIPNVAVFSATQTVTPNIIFHSTTTVTTGTLGNLGGHRFGSGNGIKVNQGLFLWNPNGKQVTTLWRRD